jgi:putative ABC transport system permease protein
MAELGVRIALRASEWRILTIILKESLFLVLSGLALGVILIFVLQRLLSVMLFGISATDPATIVVAASILTIVAGSCACVPA